MHARADAHDTLVRTPLPAAGAGTGRMAQAAPFHCSASGSEVPLLSVDCPTAVHALGDTQDTPLRMPATAPGGLGTCCTIHFRPFHARAIGDCTGTWPTETSCDANPTAVHAVARGQDTADS
jgi:hypothetical protein